MTEAQHQPTVLVVDDEAPIRLLVRVNLEAEGYRVLEASHGEEGLTLALQEQPDVILLDVMMPRMDGWEVVSRLASESAPDESGSARVVPIVFLSARAELRDHQRGLEAGAIQYLSKPFDPAELARIVREAIHAVREGLADELRAQRLAVIQELRRI